MFKAIRNDPSSQDFFEKAEYLFSIRYDTYPNPEKVREREVLAITLEGRNYPEFRKLHGEVLDAYTELFLKDAERMVVEQQLKKPLRLTSIDADLPAGVKDSLKTMSPAELLQAIKDTTANIAKDITECKAQLPQTQTGWGCSCLSLFSGILAGRRPNTGSYILS